MNKSLDILKQYWGFDNFRALQSEIVESVIYGHDTLAILPTGGGKSICFQVPGIAREGLTIVISPLIALMEDQVNNLRAKGIRANLITSSMSYREIDITLDNARFGKMQFLYTSPERIKSDLFKERCKGMNVSLIVVDEAHCISEWGHDFRPAYREIATLREIHPEAPVVALTASATERVQQDIIDQLELKSPQVFKGSLKRDNLAYKVIASENKLQKIIDFCQRNSEHTGIVYCQTRRSVKMVVEQLRAQRLSAGFYHGGLKPEDRKYMLEHWMNSDLKIMVATNAFGMGIDKPDVRYVLHFEIPNNLEAYYQEAGRAGRDGNEAQAIAYWETKDVDMMKNHLLMRYPTPERVKHIYNAVCNFLKIAIGSGNQESYDFDLHKFHTNFKVSISETYFALKILQLNDTLIFNENAFHPTRLKFAVGSSALYKFQVAHDSVASLIALLTRSYPGIFDRFIRLDDVEFMKRLKLSKAQLIEQLEYLEQYGLIDINYQSNLPKILLTHERLPDDHLTLNNQIYLQRKQNETDKLDAMLSYLDGGKCRTVLIAEYFDSTSERCGKCDICVLNASSGHSFAELIELIPERLPASVGELANSLKITPEQVQKVLHHLILEEMVIAHEGVYQRP